MRIHVVSHSHWDREWYESFASHRMKLVELFDDLIELFENDPDFHSFHLDGQTIVLDDYLEIRPERKEIVQRLVREKKLIIGPFYILQDELLITGEENVRNALVAQAYRKDWGELCPVGYFPDTFGHIGQLAQLCSKLGLRYAFFGRGVKPIGFDNQVLEDEYSSPYSEMYLESPDGSRILGILFANWYCNGNEIPTDESAARLYWDKRIADAARFASTDSLLLMNGCDHQPVQKDLSAALAVAGRLYPEHEFIHSSLEAYAKEVEAKLPADLQVIRGEMTSQETDGWFTLANTASSRIYLKEANAEIADKLTMQAEPLLALQRQAAERSQSALAYSWKQLLQNLTHDGICGCSIDEVHREMMVRFEHAETTVNHVLSEAVRQQLAVWKLQPLLQTTTDDSHPALVLMNPAPNAISGVWESEQPLEKYYFSDSLLRPDGLFQQVAARGVVAYRAACPTGLSMEVRFAGYRFGYDLSKEGFRRPYVGAFYHITAAGVMEAETAVTANLTKQPQPDTSIQRNKQQQSDGFFGESSKQIAELSFENDSLSLRVSAQGISYTDKFSGRQTDQLLTFEDCGDVGNEYVFKEPVGDCPIQAVLTGATELWRTKELCRWKLDYELSIPTAGDALFEQEKHSLIEFPARQGGRGEKFSQLPIQVILTMQQSSAAVSLQVTFDNRQKNHRLRLIIPTLRQTKTHFADSAFELVERPNTVSAQWRNPSNPQHLLKLVGAEGEDGGLLIGTTGLQEYEPFVDRLAITLLRSTDELGDWGDFPTEDSREFGISTRQLVIEAYGPKRRLHAIKQRLMTGVQPLWAVTEGAAGQTDCSWTDRLPQQPEIFYTARKAAGNGRSLVRYVNISSRAVHFTVGCQPEYVNLLEETCAAEGAIAPMEIRTEVYKGC
ncbi:MAG: glycoside hydrolase family 38 C-terminal domain-containing protein [Lachnospiraceae bacterium]|nr:glycoside hydrolase family 38 C-terminal domain-containing protein [Lachnospiraceae bacterium]